MLNVLIIIKAQAVNTWLRNVKKTFIFAILRQYILNSSNNLGEKIQKLLSFPMIKKRSEVNLVFRHNKKNIFTQDICSFREEEDNSSEPYCVYLREESNLGEICYCWRQLHINRAGEQISELMFSTLHQHFKA
jgi:hypothetical protein